MLSGTAKHPSLLQFAIDTPFAKIQVFKTALEKFIKARPREVCALQLFQLSLSASHIIFSSSVGSLLLLPRVPR
jgi:hypothetical protein